MGTPITLVFTDMVGSSAAKRAASLGPDSTSRDRAYLAGIQTKHLHVVRDAVAAHSGKEIMTIGDSFFLTFDDPVNAIQCCAAIQRRLHSEPIETASGPLQLRLGIHVGTPEYFENSWHGTDVDTAARAESAGSAQQIIVTEAARKAMGKVDGIRFRRLGTFALKGVGDMTLWDADYSGHGRRNAAARTNEQKARFRLEMMALSLLLFALGGWAVRARIRKLRPHPGVSVLVSDFINKTQDPIFDDALEQPLGVALEGSPYISIFNRNQAKKTSKEIGASGAKLDESTARLIAQREGIAYVVSGSVERRGGKYRLTGQAVDSVSGRQIGKESVVVSAREDVLKNVSRVAASIRAALGDTTPESAQLSDAETYTAGSLEAAKAYNEAQNLQWAGKWDEATKAYKEALRLDPRMGRAYSGLAVVAANSGDAAAAAQYFKQAMANIGRMSERERYRTRGGYYLQRRDTVKAIDEYSQLLRKFPADSAARANLAVAYAETRDMPKALEEGEKAIALLPKNVPQRNNLGLLAMYAGAFERGIKEQDQVLALNPGFNLAYVGKAICQLGLGEDTEAINTWQALSKLNQRGASRAALGMADLALYQGRIEDAVHILRKGADEDVAANNKDEAGIKLATLAYAQAYRHNRGLASATADQAIAMSQEVETRMIAAESYVMAGETAKAHALAVQLAMKLDNDPRAYALLIDGMVLLRMGKAVAAIGEMQKAQKIADTWIGHFYLGQAYLEAKAYEEADSEFDACQRRKGEATALFLDEEPTYHLMPLVDYYNGIAREGMKSPSAIRSFEAFTSVRAKHEQDPLVLDALRRETRVEPPSRAVMNAQ
jgi:class 3 adenylate cyclase/tetratricopeptide (TPR) repeat protein